MNVAVPARDDEYEALLEFLYLCPVGVVECDRDGAIRRLNPVASQLLIPFSLNGALENFFDLMGRCAPELRNWTHDFGSPSGKICQDHRVFFETAGGGEPTRLAITLVQLREDRIAAVLSDIGELIRQEMALRERESQLRAIFETLREYAVYTLNASGTIDGWNASGQRLFGYDASEAVGCSMDDFHQPDDTDASETDPNETLQHARQRGWYEEDGWRRRKDGSRFWANGVTTVLVGDDGQPRGYSVIVRDMTERKELEDRLRRMANTDYLTGVYTRRYFCEAGEREMMRVRRHGGSLSVLLIDADYFKRINDSLGHAAGDAVLKAIASTCSGLVRGEDLFARLGGEEFGVLAPSSDLDGALVLAERIRAAIAALAVPTGESTTTPTVSIGIAQASANTTSFDAVLSEADQALYRAKEAGRNCVVAG